MTSHDQTPQKPTGLRRLLNLVMAAFSVVLAILAVAGVVMTMQEEPFGLPRALLTFFLLSMLGAIVLGVLSRAKPLHLIGSAFVGGLLLGGLALSGGRMGRMASPQLAAVGSLRSINSAEVTYASTYPNGYSPTLSCLGQPPGGINPSPTAAGLIDSVLAGTGNISEKSGYRFVYQPGAPDAKGQINSYSITASPIKPGVTGLSYYYTDQTAVIRGNSSAPASAADSPIAG